MTLIGHQERYLSCIKLSLDSYQKLKVNFGRPGVGVTQESLLHYSKLVISAVVIDV